MATIERIILNTSNGKEFYNMSDILFIKSDGAYSHINFENGKTKTVSKKLKTIYEELNDSRFFRIHHSYIANIEYAKEVDVVESAALVLRNGMKLPISRRKKVDFLNLFIKL